MARKGDSIGPYTLVRELGRGSFGVVWLATQTVRTFDEVEQKEYALKLPRWEVDVDAFKVEAKLWAKASGHPNVLPLVEAGIYGNQIVIVSEYAADGSLKDWLQTWLKGHKDQPPALEVVVDMIGGILDGLAHLHSRKIIHRDLKPANILLQGQQPRLADFGLSRVFTSTSGSRHSAGTPAYMAPEAFDKKRSEQTDIWSAGVIFYELLSGHLPFVETEHWPLVTAIKTKPPQPLPDSIPQGLQEIVTRALHRDRTERYSSAAQMRSALDAWCRHEERKPESVAVGERELPSQELEAQSRDQTLRLQTQTKSIRAQALQVEASEWMPRLWEQGVAHEQEADHKLAERNYFQAHDAYKEAIRLFERAREEALTAGRQKTETARQSMLTIKSEADWYGATDRAQRFYRDGLALEDQARALAEKNQYRPAVEVYEKATTVFRDARELALAVLQRQISEEEARIGSAKAAAQAEGAEQFATEHFQKATHSEEEGAAALVRGELLQGYMLLRTACEQYERARTQAHLEGQRQHAVVWRQRADDARAKADNRKADHYAVDLYQQAKESQTQGNNSFEGQQYEEAAQAYERALQGYEQAVQESEQAQQRQLAITRQVLTAATEAARQSEVEKQFPSETVEVQQLVQQGEDAAVRGEWSRAIECFHRAAAELEQLSRAAEEQERLLEVQRQAIEQQRQREALAAQQHDQQVDEATATAVSTDQQHAQETIAQDSHVLPQARHKVLWLSIVVVLLVLNIAIRNREYFWQPSITKTPNQSIINEDERKPEPPQPSIRPPDDTPSATEKKKEEEPQEPVEPSKQLSPSSLQQPDKTEQTPKILRELKGLLTLGLIHLRRSEYAEARAAFEKARLKVDPTSQDALAGHESTQEAEATGATSSGGRNN